MRALLCATAALVLAAGGAGAQQLSCGPVDAVLSRLQEGYGERPAGWGMAPNGAVVERLQSADGRTWTLILLLPSGAACVLAAGRDWSEEPLRPAEPPGAPS